VDDDAARIVAAGYDQVADGYERLEEQGHEWPRLRRLRELLADVPEGGRVLDLGCGNGVPALQEIGRRHQATGVDVSGVQAERARQNVPAATVLHADMVETDFAEESFDAIVSFYAVEHVPREHHAELFRRFHSWLRPGGRLLFTVEARATHDAVGDWLGTPMFFSQFGPEETIELVREAGFTIESADVEPQLEGGTEIEYLWIRARRRQ
jgi:cyclopropane fatty-acyl-phospholipid synthase-like methyltransferase